MTKFSMSGNVVEAFKTRLTLSQLAAMLTQIACLEEQAVPEETRSSLLQSAKLLEQLDEWCEPVDPTESIFYEGDPTSIHG